MSPNILQSVRDEEEQMFEEYLTTECKENPDVVRKRMQYVREYCLLQPESDGFDEFVSDEAIRHCRTREQRLEYTDISEREFYELEDLQEAIQNLSLCKEATFEFILYLWTHLKRWKTNGTHERTGEESDTSENSFKHIGGNMPVEVTIKVGNEKTTYIYNGPLDQLINQLESWDDKTISATEVQRTKIGQAQYYLIATILKNLPIKHKKTAKGTYSKYEINLALSALWLVKEKIRKEGEEPCDFFCEGMNSRFYEVMNRYNSSELVHIGQKL